ncbi:unnamed protein product [Notodromas monacha]|uniref:Cytochrome c oxidase assembly factor 6 homolog n=1 Tax=Notodromas monacha TaxID=399045 RepID=A0A7R9BM41_9CRUS|nr:unnamed protein product [Notodromas monacha]CAG0916693.1 unnamed protein product [Notodromas monacha]
MRNETAGNVNIAFNLFQNALKLNVIMASETAEKPNFPTKSERQRCWAARDDYWACLDKEKMSEDACSKFREAFCSSCPLQWVKHFDRRYKYLKFKEKMETEGFDPVEGPEKS